MRYRYRVALLLLFLCVPAFAQEEYCAGVTVDRLSNDRDGILGDEEMCWAASDEATYYVLGVMHWIDDGSGSWEVTPCGTTPDTGGMTIRYPLPPDSTCYSDGIVVKACMPDPENGPDLCSEYNIMEPVEILPYACIRNNWCREDSLDARLNYCDACEYPCFLGAPRRLPLRYPACS